MSLTGERFGDVLERFEDAVVVGLKTEAGSILLGPDDDLVFFFFFSFFEDLGRLYTPRPR